MRKEIEEKKKRLKEATQALRDKEEQVFTLTSKKFELAASLGGEVCNLAFASGPCTATGSPCLNIRRSCKCLGAFSPITTGGVRQKVLDAEERKKTIMHEFVSGEKTRTEVDKAVKAFEEAKGELEVTESLLTATEEVLKKAQMEVVNMIGGVGKAKQAVWGEIYQKLKIEIRDSIGDRVIQAIAATCQSDSQASPQYILLDIFGTYGPVPSIPPFPVLEEAAKRLEKEYGLMDDTPSLEDAEMRVG